jgi:hypothetical protein
LEIEVTRDEEEDVGSYWMTLRKAEDTLILKEDALDCTVWRAGFGDRSDGKTRKKM